jgi:hypothetical protein
MLNCNTSLLTIGFRFAYDWHISDMDVALQFVTCLWLGTGLATSELIDVCLGSDRVMKIM